MNLGAKMYVVRWFQKCASDPQACNCKNGDTNNRLTKIAADGEQIILSCPHCKFENMVHPMLFLMMQRAFTADPKNEDKIVARLLVSWSMVSLSLMLVLGTAAVVMMNHLADRVLILCLVGIVGLVVSFSQVVKFMNLHEIFNEASQRRRTSR